MEGEAVSVEDLRKRLGDAVLAAVRDGRVTMVTYHGVTAAALVPASWVTDRAKVEDVYTPEVARRIAESKHKPQPYSKGRQTGRER